MMKQRIISLIALLILYLNANAQPKQSYGVLPAKEFANQIKINKKAIIVDVRTPEEFEKGHIENASNIDWKQKDFDSLAIRIQKDDPVFVYCLSGGRSSQAASRLKSLGFTNVKELDGGILNWRAKSLLEIGSNGAKGMTISDYEKLLVSDKLVLVDFYADWCVPCKEMKPYLDRITNENSTQVTVVRINADTNSELCKKLGVSGLPVVRLYRNKKQVWNQLGFIDEAGLRKKLKLP